MLMAWESTRFSMRVHPTAVIIVQTWINSPDMEWKWEVKGDTAVKYGYASTADRAKEDALKWWNQFTKTLTRSLQE